MMFDEPLNGEEVIQVYGSSELFTVNSILQYVEENIGPAGGGYSSQSFVLSGAAGPSASLGEFIGWLSASSGNKTQPIPASTGSLQLICIMDLAGTATNLAQITAVPLTGVVTGNASVYTAFGRIILLDTSMGWVSI